jgi:hypothetical protein
MHGSQTRLGYVPFSTRGLGAADLSNVNQSPEQSAGFSANCLLNPFLLGRLKRTVSQFRQANLEAAYAGQGGKPLLRDP